MAGWHNPLNGHEFEQTLGDSGGQRSCSPQGRKESDRTEQLNNDDLTKKVCKPASKTFRSPARYILTSF